MVAAKTTTDAALYWFFGARDSRGPRDLHAVRPKLVAGLTANTACTCFGLPIYGVYDTVKAHGAEGEQEERRGYAKY